ncbi:MAG: tetratricopeptide repeat protein [Bacteroidota bacterium]
MPTKHIFFTFLFSLFISSALISQNNLIDSLIKESKKVSIHDSIKIKLFGDISWEYMSSDLTKSLEFANKELNLATISKREADIAQAESDIGSIYNRKSVFDTALIHYNNALSLREKLKQDVKIAGVYTNIATVLMRQSRFEESLAINFKSLKLFEKTGDELKQSIALGNIGNMYYELAQPKLAEQYYRKSLELARKTKNVTIEGNALVNIGGIKFDIGVKKDSVVNALELDSALYYFISAETILIKQNALYNLTSVYNNIGRINFHKKDFKKALSFYEKSLEARILLEDKFGIGLTYINLAETENKLGNTKKNIEYLSKAADIFLSLKNYINLKQVYGKLAEAYQLKKDYLASLKYYQLFESYKDSVFNENSNKQMAEMQTKYDVEKKDLELAKNKADIEIEKNKKYITYGALAFFILLFSLSIWAFVQKRKNARVLEVKNIELEGANEKISHQKEELVEKQKEILDSIYYAKKIQNALLANEEMLMKNLVDHFILFKPKDIVSGDFTWATMKDNLFYLACCDSTGHGVPGAFMSLLNIGFLSEAIKERNITEPGKVFNYVRERLIETIGNDHQKDGFDGILLCMNIDTKEITYAAANNSPLIVRNKELIHLKTNKMPVGEGIKTDSFDTFSLDYEKGDSLYLYTDGYPDQFGGSKGKKLKYKPMEEILAANSDQPTLFQKETLDQNFESWRGKLEQVDDVCVIGVKL